MTLEEIAISVIKTLPAYP